MHETHPSRIEQLTFIDPPIHRSPDSLPVRSTTPDVLDMQRVEQHIVQAVERGRYRGPTDPLEYLLHKHCLVRVGDTPYVTLGGMMCFAREPQAVFPRAVIDIGHYRGLEPISTDVLDLRKDIGGTLFDQLGRVEEYLWEHTRHGMTLSDSGFQRIEVHEYPRAVIRELCVNMLAHRDYANFLSAARVQIFRDRIEWVSPGGLPPGVTVDNILAEQVSRNPVIQSILYEAGYVEAFGQGLDTVVAVLKREDLPPPRFYDTGASFIVTVFGRAMDAYLNGDDLGLNEPQRVILNFLRTHGEASPRELRALFPQRAERSVQRDLKGMVDDGLIETIGGPRWLPPPGYPTMYWSRPLPPSCSTMSSPPATPPPPTATASPCP
ncbi:MAG: hypothetical protein HC911_06970 [Chloroflexaceae bacterium]|nr:hypothetical protein [Chloroflexaceae bacterium]